MLKSFELFTSKVFCELLSISLEVSGKQKFGLPLPYPNGKARIILLGQQFSRSTIHRLKFHVSFTSCNLPLALRHEDLNLEWRVLFLWYFAWSFYSVGLPQGLSSKESVCSTGDTGDRGSIPEWGRYPGGGNGNPLQCSCLGNPIDRGAWQATVHGITKSQIQLSNWASTHAYSTTSINME